LNEPQFNRVLAPRSARVFDLERFGHGTKRGNGVLQALSDWKDCSNVPEAGDLQISPGFRMSQLSRNADRLAVTC
jgi:hypothetical protein